jgi:hypothetical protein
MFLDSGKREAKNYLNKELDPLDMEWAKRFC